MDPLKKLAGLGATKKASSLFEEFKKFAFKGNVVDLAIGVIIGAAFGAIVKSLVEDIIMPLIGLVLPGDKGYEGWAWHVGDKTVPYGKFLGAVVNFLLVALVLYLFIVKFLGWILKSQQEQAAVPAPPTRDQELLTEIRDLLKQRAAEPGASADLPRDHAPVSSTAPPA
jgi:large conductance mechanosensitive channel